ncbi:hypothetical protein [Pseudomonas brassicacearum]|uniref:hypothetical protein n=1 Tax=Pseudomonas brassicacearum TaxID=930166 RepID=UPI0007219743|nr:hypothetical protein [Pseudomonas brassicacearum]ALQ01316.1 hypothetical protein AK973_0867 [Pseudomonas brassicacearum]
MSGPDTLSAVDTMDQAAGLRRWAEQNKAPHTAIVHEAEPAIPDRTLIVFGTARMTSQVHLTLERWHQQGHRWIGHPNHWRVLPVENSRRDLRVLTLQQPRWGLWIDSDLDAFGQAFQRLRQLSEQGGPDHVLALHPGFPRQGLLCNLQEAAQRYLGIRLLLIHELNA